MADTDAVVIGSGPNGLVAAAVLARAGWRVTVLERSGRPGGAVQSAELTVPGYVHDPYSAFYGLLHCSPVFTELGLDRAVPWARFEVPVAAAVSPRHVAAVHADVAGTARELGRVVPSDGEAWSALYRWWLEVGRAFLRQMLGPVGAPGPALAFAARTWRRGLLDTTRTLLEPLAELAADRFEDGAARALLACGASHADVPVDSPGSVPAALVLALAAQEVGMPVPVGGAGRLAAALVAAVEAAGGVVRCDAEVTRVVLERGRAVGVEVDGSVPVRAARAVLADTGPAALFTRLVGEEAVPARYLAGLRRFRYGTGVFKVDLALDGPAPWAAPGLGGCGVVHLTGDLDDMARAACQARHGDLPDTPMLIVGQQSVADPTRAPAGGHTLWVETHVPPRPRGAASWTGAAPGFLEVVLARLEAHAPGLRGRVVGQAVRTPEDLERENPNLVGGDLGAGSMALDQQLVFRPVPGWFRYATPVRGLYLCSASAHPGGGVHGMAGRNCARRVLADRRRRR